MKNFNWFIVPDKINQLFGRDEIVYVIKTPVVFYVAIINRLQFSPNCGNSGAEYRSKKNATSLQKPRSKRSHNVSV